jgi:trehalose utilization protein
MKCSLGLIVTAVCVLLPLSESVANDKVRVLIWDEQQPEQKQGYDGRFLGDSISDHLRNLPGISVDSVGLSSPGQGLDDKRLDSTDVVIWWGHRKHLEVAPDASERLVKRVLDGKLSLVVLHSAHFARPFMSLMDERAKADAPGMVPASEQAGAVMDFSVPLRRGKAERNAALSPSVEKVDGVWRLVLPACVFPAWRADGLPSQMTTLLPDHPIARGLPKQWTIPKTEMYDEPFHVPAPDEVIFEERWEKGEHFRSACVWKAGRGRVFYFRPGHETYPVFKQTENLLVLENAVRWLKSQLPVDR